MLHRRSDIVIDCYRRAIQAAERAAEADCPTDRDFWLACEQHWLDLAKSYEASERLNDFVQSRPITDRDDAEAAGQAQPGSEETLRLVNALNLITDRDKLEELFALAERLASQSPRFAELQQRLKPRH